VGTVSDSLISWLSFQDDVLFVARQGVAAGTAHDFLFCLNSSGSKVDYIEVLSLLIMT